MTNTTTKKIIIAAFAAVILAVGSLAASGDANARGRGGHGWHGGGHGGHHSWGHKGRGHRWQGRPSFGRCHLVFRPGSRPLKICPRF